MTIAQMSRREATRKTNFSSGRCYQWIGMRWNDLPFNLLLKNRSHAISNHQLNSKQQWWGLFIYKEMSQNVVFSSPWFFQVVGVADARGFNFFFWDAAVNLSILKSLWWYKTCIFGAHFRIEGLPIGMHIFQVLPFWLCFNLNQLPATGVLSSGNNPSASLGGPRGSRTG